MEEYLKYYRWLYDIYSRRFADPEKVLSAHLMEFIEKGYSLEDALKELYRRAYINIYLPSLSLTELLEISWNRFKRNPVLSVPVLFNEAAPALSTLAVLMIMFVLISYFSQVGLLSKIIDALISGDYLIFLKPEVLHPILVALFPACLAVLIFYTLGQSVCSSFIFSLAEDSLRKDYSRLEDVWSKAIKNLPRVFLATLLKNLVVYVVPLAGLSLLLYLGLQYLDVLAALVYIIILLLLVALYMIAAEVALIYVEPSVIIGSKKAIEAFRESILLVRENFSKALGYFLLQVVVAIIVGTISGLLSYFHILFSEAATLILLLIVRPVFVVLLAGIYMSLTGRVFNASRLPELRLLTVAGRLMGRGLEELVELAKKPRWIFAAAAIFLLGALGGFGLAQIGLKDIISKSVGLGKGLKIFREYFTLSIFTDIFLHNWRIAAFTTVSGIFTYAAPFSIALFNGLIIGAIATVMSPLDLVIGIMPHGIIEIPGFLLATAAGLRLAYELYTEENKAEKVKKAAYVALGLIPVFATAAFIEAFITPLIIDVYLKSFRL